MISSLQPKRPGTHHLSDNEPPKSILDGPQAQQRREQNTEATGPALDEQGSMQSLPEGIGSSKSVGENAETGQEEGRKMNTAAADT